MKQFMLYFQKPLHCKLVKISNVHVLFEKNLKLLNGLHKDVSKQLPTAINHQSVSDTVHVHASRRVTIQQFTRRLSHM